LGRIEPKYKGNPRQNQIQPQNQIQINMAQIWQLPKAERNSLEKRIRQAQINVAKYAQEQAMAQNMLDNAHSNYIRAQDSLRKLLKEAGQH